MSYTNDIGPLSASVVRQLQGRVPWDTLVEFLAKVSGCDDPASIGRQAAARMVDRIHVYALEPINGDNLIVLPLSLAMREAQNEEGAVEAKTFGEFAANSPDGAYCCDVLTEYAEYPEFEDYLATLDIELEDEDEGGPEAVARNEATLVGPRKEYDDLGPYGWRPPRDDDPFDRDIWDEYCFNYGVSGAAVGFFNPPEAMYDALPTSVLAKFADIGSGAMGGTFVNFNPDDQDAIVAHMEELGYILVRDDLLIAACYGEGPGSSETAKRVAWYDQVEKLRSDLAAGDREVQS